MWVTLVIASMLTADGGTEWRARVEASLEAHRQKYAGWRKRSMPPRPSIVELDLPEAVLSSCLGERDAGSCPGSEWLYLEALAAKATPTSAEVVFSWASRQSYPASAYWVLAMRGPVRSVVELQRRDAAKSTQSLAYALALTRAGDLEPTERTRLYELLRAQVDRPANGDSSALWKALHALQPGRARDELAAMLDARGDIYVLFGLQWEPRPMSDTVRAALLARVNDWERSSRDLFNDVLLENLGDEAVPALKAWLSREASRRDSAEAVTRLLTVLARQPASPVIDAWIPALVRDERLPQYERWLVLRAARERNHPKAAELSTWWRSLKRCCD
ncbi:MAG: hypothetical protein Q8L14_28475 [Myxococcales bacterium]|nr:hypothetical protein [Myxococcales bacterium]